MNTANKSFVQMFSVLSLNFLRSKQNPRAIEKMIRISENGQFHTVETVWRLVDGQLIFNPIESKLPIFDSVCNSTNNAAEKGHSTFLIPQK